MTAGVCVIHLLHNTLRYAGREDWEKIAKDLRPVYTGATRDAAALLEEFAEVWGSRCPAMVRLWRSFGAEFVPSWPVTSRSGR